MKKPLFLISIITSLFFCSIVFTSISNAVYFASDSVYLYEDGKRIHDNNIIFIASYKTYNEECTDGLCSIGQQFYPVTIRKTKSDFVISFDPGPSEGGEGCGSPGCMGGRIGDYRSYVLDINNGNYKQILGKPEKNFDENEEVIPLDKENLKKEFISTNNIIYLFIFIILLILISQFKKYRRNRDR